MFAAFCRQMRFEAGMTSDILIGIGGLVLSALTYFAGVQRAERRLSRTDGNERVQRVFSRYMDFRRTNFTGGIDGLQKAGIATLVNNDEINDLFDIIVKHGEKHPLGSSKDVISPDDMKKFFDYSAEAGVNFLRTPVEKILEQIKIK